MDEKELIMIVTTTYSSPTQKVLPSGAFFDAAVDFCTALSSAGTRFI